ncbi:hypothetical protein [Jeongeupia sp. USM3]|uniref:hypothetical protein n=1 Tax=Jeongeupia sp. USM3 TaxID=1906741 RepID=UPI00089DE694|nr:hypothetical protein [Jeongeupia sp. USM3]AOY01062.1 hypothetical protein BJP62_11780 [Jeongeupia sp. USM3]
MSTESTTHLICAPDFDDPATVAALCASPGAHVDADAVLLTLRQGDGSERHVGAPDAGTLACFTVAVGDPVQPGELVALMDIVEAPTGWLFPPAGTVAADTPDTDWLTVSTAAARLAARLGVDLAELPAGDRIDVADVEHYVRERLARR